MTTNEPKLNFWAMLGIASKEVFRTLLMAYLVLAGLEFYKKGFVTYFFNLNLLLIALLVSGVIVALFEPRIWRQTLPSIKSSTQKLVGKWKLKKSIDGIW